MKHLFKLSLLLLTLLLPATAAAHDFEVDGIYYNINGNEVSVTYKGTSPGSYTDRYSGSVIIPATVTYNGTTYSVTSIGNSAFSGCSGLTSVTIGNSVTTIGDGAFHGCSGLTSIDIPNSVTSIGNSAFYGCSGLTSVTIPNSITSIGYRAFYGCTSLTSVTISNSVASIGVQAFWGCSGLTTIDIPNSVTTIGDYAFYGCSGLTSVTIGNSVTTIGTSAFSGCTGITDLIWNAQNCSSLGYMPTSNIERVTIGNEVVALPNSFVSGSKITSVIIPNSVTSIGSNAFYNCRNLPSISLPYSITSIGDGAFYYCESLERVVCKAITPPRIGNYYSIYPGYYMATLYVPERSVEAYRATEYWSNFINILGYESEDDVPHDASQQKCDTNDDGEVNISDVNKVIDAILGH